MSGSTAPPSVAEVLGKLIKPGTRTSEFLGMVTLYAGVLAAVLGAFNTSSPTANAWIKSAALIAGAVYGFGYSISRGNVKQALADLTTAAIREGILPLRPPVPPAPASAAAVPPDAYFPEPAQQSTGQTGVSDLLLIGAVLLVLGVTIALLVQQTVVVILAVVIAVAGLLLVLSGAGARLRV